MKNKIFAILLCALLVLMVGCDKNTAVVKPATEKNDVTVNDKQYVIALNPVLVDNGTSHLLSKDIANSMSKDSKNKTATEFYDNTDWQWIFKDGTDYKQRLVRELEPFMNGKGESGKNMPYTYSFNDDRTDMLAYFDSSKMDLGSYNDDIITSKGVLFALTGDEEEILCYTAQDDMSVNIKDTSGGNISLIKSVQKLSTDTISKNKSDNIILKIYKNSKVLWQEKLDSETTSVEFPEIEDITLTSGDVIMISAQVVSTVSDFKNGYTDYKESYDKTTKIPHITTEKVLIENENPEDVNSSNQIPFLDETGDSNFTIIRSKDATAEIISTISDLRTKMSNAIGTSVAYNNDGLDNDGYLICVYDTKYQESKDAIAELKQGGANSQADFIIRVNGKKVVIAAYTKSGLELAIDYFMSNYCTSKKSSLDKNLNFVSRQHLPKKDIYVNGNTISNYKIVTSNVASYIETASAKYIQKKIATISGYELPVIRDSVAADSREIVVGNTNRTNSLYQTVASSKVNNSYDISIKGSNIYIIGDETYGTNSGALRFCSELDNNSNFKDGYSLKGDYDGKYSLTDGYKLTWSDEFNGNKLERTWKNQVESKTGKAYYGGNVYNLAKNATVSDGSLNLHAYTDGIDQYGASLTTCGSKPLWYKYGYAEVRVKFSTTQGVCNAFWTKASLVTEFLETDIYETFGSVDNAKCNLHTWGPTGHRNLLGGVGSILNLAPGTTVPEPYGYKYHTFGWEWSDDRVNFYYDGVMNSTFDCSGSTFDSFDKAAYFIIDCTISEVMERKADGTVSYYGKKPPEKVNDYTKYDWIRIYQKDNDGAVLLNKN